jgi:hypothetical protein
MYIPSAFEEKDRGKPFDFLGRPVEEELCRQLRLG